MIILYNVDTRWEVVLFMPQTTISIRVDENIKRDAEALFNHLGLTMSSAVNVFFRQAIMEEAIPFQVKYKRKHLTLKDRLEGFDGDYEFNEWDTGASVGSEIIE